MMSSEFIGFVEFIGLTQEPNEHKQLNKLYHSAIVRLPF
jgi:hypothetical protein